MENRMGNRVPDIFISYSSKNHHWVSGLAAALKSANYQVWWDEELIAGQNFHDSIPEALEKATCVLVVWCEHSIKSEWVQGEASRGNERGALIPVLSQPVDVPMAFSSLHTADLRSWSNETHEACFQKLVKAIDYKINGLEAKEISHSHFSPEKSTKVASLQKSNRGCSVSVAVTLSVFFAVFTVNSLLRGLEMKEEAETALKAVALAVEKKQQALDNLVKAATEVELHKQQIESVLSGVEKRVLWLSDSVEIQGSNNKLENLGLLYKKSYPIGGAIRNEYGKLTLDEKYIGEKIAEAKWEHSWFSFAGHGASTAGRFSGLTDDLVKAEIQKQEAANLVAIAAEFEQEKREAAGLIIAEIDASSWLSYLSNPFGESAQSHANHPY